MQVIKALNSISLKHLDWWSPMSLILPNETDLSIHDSTVDSLFTVQCIQHCSIFSFQNSLLPQLPWDHSTGFLCAMSSEFKHIFWHINSNIFSNLELQLLNFNCQLYNTDPQIYIPGPYTTPNKFTHPNVHRFSPLTCPILQVPIGSFSLWSLFY